MFRDAWADGDLGASFEWQRAVLDRFIVAGLGPAAAVLGCPSAAGAGRLATTRGEQSTGVRESQPPLRGRDGRAALRARSGKTRLCKQGPGLSGSLATAGDTSQPDAGFLLSARSFASGYMAWGLRG